MVRCSTKSHLKKSPIKQKTDDAMKYLFLRFGMRSRAAHNQAVVSQPVSAVQSRKTSSSLDVSAVSRLMCPYQPAGRSLLAGPLKGNLYRPGPRRKVRAPWKYGGG